MKKRMEQPKVIAKAMVCKEVSPALWLTAVALVSLYLSVGF